MDKATCCCDEAHAARFEATTAQLKVKELEKLLAEATQLLFVESGKPSRELFGWWYRRDYAERRKGLFVTPFEAQN